MVFVFREKSKNHENSNTELELFEQDSCEIPAPPPQQKIKKGLLHSVAQQGNFIMPSADMLRPAVTSFTHVEMLTLGKNNS